MQILRRSGTASAGFFFFAFQSGVRSIVRFRQRKRAQTGRIPALSSICSPPVLPRPLLVTVSWRGDISRRTSLYFHQTLNSGLPLSLDLNDMVAPSLLSLGTLLFSLYTLPGLAIPTTNDPRSSDPCAKISGKKWVAPADVRACFASFKVDPVEKTNVRVNHSPHPFPQFSSY
jgi:hypothetical protein